MLATRQFKAGWLNPAKYSYVAEPFEVAAQAGQTVVTAHLEGDFPGSPVDLRYQFTLEGDKIARLEIGV